MGVVVSVGAGATIPLSAPPAQPAVPIVAVVNHSATDDALFLGQFCGGVPTTHRTVVTATHCLTGRTAGTIDVVAGVIDLCSHATPARVRRTVVSIAAVPDSGGTLSMLTLSADLDGPVVDRPARVLPMPGSLVAGWGWGRTAVSGTPACVLRRVDLRVVDVDECRTLAAGTYVSDAAEPSGVPVSLCTVPLGTANTCVGDSGGPVTVSRAQDPQRLYVVGITLSGDGCGARDRGLAVVPQ